MASETPEPAAAPEGPSERVYEGPAKIQIRPPGLDDGPAAG